MSSAASSTAGMPNVPPPHNHSAKPMRILACVLCQHRKIKCDRTFPCANCLKANVTCTPSTPAPARKRRRPNQDLQERLARCEELLKAYASAKPEGEDAPTPSTMLANDHHDCSPNVLTGKLRGKLIVEDDGGVRFADSYLFGTIHDELSAMREIIEGEDNEDLTPETTVTPDENAELILGGSGNPSIDGSQTARLEALHPSPAHIFRLWQIYLERVNPLTKVIHVPTLQPYLVEAASGSHNLPQNIKTLLFAIYTLATVSMTHEECINLLGCTREAALQQFSDGVRLSLIRTGFLKTHDLETLQALVIYLISLQGRYNRHAAWILNGVVLRIAQKMGVHRDGEVLGLSPFETEMRRRVWWQIIMVDAKYALMSGLSHSMLPHVWDTKEPNNVNDADLFPAATEPVQNREGPTEMIMVLLTNRVARFLLETPGIEPIFLLGDADTFGHAGGPPQEHVTLYRRLISDLGQSLVGIIDRYCDPNAGALHEMAIQVKAEIIDKLETILLPSDDDRLGDRPATPADTVFRIAVKAIATDHMRHARTGGPFAWFARLDFQISIFLFIVGQLCTRRSGPLVDAAWENVQVTYENIDDLYDITQRSHYQAAAYVLKAWRGREAVLRERLGGKTPETPSFILQLQAAMPPQDEFIKTETMPSTSASASASPFTTMAAANAAANINAAVGRGNHAATMINTTSAAAHTNSIHPTSAVVANGPSLLPPADLSMSPSADDKALVEDPLMDQMLAQTFFDPNTIDWDMWGGGIPTFGGLGTVGTAPHTQW